MQEPETLEAFQGIEPFDFDTGPHKAHGFRGLSWFCRALRIRSTSTCDTATSLVMTLASTRQDTMKTYIAVTSPQVRALLNFKQSSSPCVNMCLDFKTHDMPWLSTRTGKQQITTKPQNRRRETFRQSCRKPPRELQGSSKAR